MFWMVFVPLFMSIFAIQCQSYGLLLFARPAPGPKTLQVPALSLEASAREAEMVAETVGGTGVGVEAGLIVIVLLSLPKV